VFTGIVQKVGRIRSLDRGETGARIGVEASFEKLALGESIAVDGACLTVVRADGAGLEIEATAETLARTTLGDRAVGDGVNLERSLAVGDLLGGHLVLGHVDGVGRVVSKGEIGDGAAKVVFWLPAPLCPLVAPKGAIAVDGVSLTVNGVGEDTFDVVLIPFTRRETALDGRNPGARVNLEADVVARYVLRALEARSG
jgi:riboflavin synthase